jgi:hypothetical protein
MNQWRRYVSFVDKSFIKKYFKDKRVALFGSAPSCLENNGKTINEYDIIVRVNNYKIKGFEDRVGTRTDVHYSFYGSSIKKSKEELIEDGVHLCMCKCPNAVCHMTDWHIKNNHKYGCDFRYINKKRENWWFCDTYIPTKEHYMNGFNLLGKHVPTCGFSAILDIIECEPKELYITGFTFMKCEVCGKRGWECKCETPAVGHNVNEKWRRKNPDDPIKHLPGKEYALLKEYANKYDFIKLDGELSG